MRRGERQFMNTCWFSRACRRVRPTRLQRAPLPDALLAAYGLRGFSAVLLSPLASPFFATSASLRANLHRATGDREARHGSSTPCPAIRSLLSSSRSALLGIVQYLFSCFSVHGPTGIHGWPMPQYPAVTQCSAQPRPPQVRGPGPGINPGLGAVQFGGELPFPRDVRSDSRAGPPTVRPARCLPTRPRAEGGWQGGSHADRRHVAG
jgi:hypothetical protein